MDVDELVVTGSRLRVEDYVAVNPVTTLGADNLERSGVTNVTEYLTDIPALTASQDLSDGADTSTPSQAGLSLLNLRNLGTDRTLVLVDGRRHVSSDPGTAGVDINAIPVALIERVEILTGGASAVYGADGVSGVVNFILKKKFEGVDFRAQGGVSDAGGGESQFVSALVGQNFSGGRGNITLGVEWANDEALKINDRKYTRVGQRRIVISNPDDPGTFDADLDDPNIPDNILASNVRYIDTSRAGSIYTNFYTAESIAGVSFLGNGQPFVNGEYAGGFFMIGGSGTLLDEYNDDLLPGLERMTASLNLGYDLADNHRLFGELKYNKSETGFSAQPSYDYGLFVSDENPFIPANVLADARTEGGLATPEGAADFGLPTGVLVARDNFDLGTQSYDIEREVFRIVGGIEGDLSPNLHYEASYVYGEARQDLFAYNVRLNDRYYAATDVVVDPATGRPVCRSNLDAGAVPIGDVFGQFGFPEEAFGATFTPGANSGCVPLNIFGEGAASPEAIAWVNGSGTQRSKIDQHVVNAFISGDTTDWFSLPAGPIAFVVGAEYRREGSDFKPSDLEVLGEDLEYPISGLGRGVRTKGHFDVKEAFTEVSVPLLRDMPFAQELTARGAFRYSDYSTSGGTSTWNLGGQWRPVQDLMFRATKARAVRAPNIVNLFQANVQTFGTFADPCSAENLGLGENPSLRRQNCAAALTALGVTDPSSFINNSSEAVAGFISGNPDLKPEKADTWTIGGVLTPRFIPGLSISVDYYDIEINDAIQSYTSQTIVNNCYDLPQPNTFCDLVTRTAGGFNPGRITSFQQVPGNIARYETAGYDFTVRYLLDPADFGVQRDVGTLQFNLIGNRLEKLVFVETSGAEPDDDLGEREAPKWQVNLDVTWQWKQLSVNYGLNYFDETLRYPQRTLDNEPDYIDPAYFKYDARMTHDVQVRYEVRDGFNVYGGINNVGDQKPEPSDYIYPVSPLGRFFYLGVRASLDSL
ncbi:TonB-dependent receptor domain-containing protein [Phenylobacterium sp. J367]|uniref:TonB-dependent receptor domain-containing protein n=1 Tax=Phenylobacterium sp. J367 TaxID=2898435 RepID=UPI0021511EE8|nr:TonB-dependent receptor [Phenylobacterium sp. J367]MCR5877046.1 TonB-dependent receptor [Phenylobacterium sp. J367]